MMADVHTRERRSLILLRIRSRYTEPEVRLRSLLHKAGYWFCLHASELPGRTDIVMPKHRAVIFVNGCFWHRHESCRFATTPATRAEFLQNKFDGTIKRDQRKRDLLEKSGWRVIPIWDCDQRAFPDRTLGEVTKQLGEPH